MNLASQTPLFFIENDDASDSKIIPADEVSTIQNNLYSYKSTTYLGVNYYESKLVDNKIKKVVKGIFLYDVLLKKPIDQIIDIKSYKPILDHTLYKDKSNIYYISNDAYIPSVRVLDLNSGNSKILDDTNEYLSDGNKIYCIRNGKEIETDFVSTFKVIKVNGIPLGIDSTKVYSMCEALSPKDFKENFESIKINSRDSIINKYFKNLE
ncbi:hypothetical protein AWE51_15180 [Aquimarina aggregata]|uniref:Uncharacterized protein n=1 Tax=Aquimarina aggregata TaxID=1642818 RepID=A0A162Y4W4_9FLAO|nr:DKNYY domain-containing protein [Aquimarina aggregata]KZS38922.1 hypothetical protein AWE51_15180 [Aquimarina aggregata]